MEKVIFSRMGGLGIILHNNEKESDFFGTAQFLVNDTLLIPGDYTDLFGLFSENVKYVGNLLTDPNCMIFSLGSDDDLFEKKHYYSCFYWIHDKRLVNKYTDKTARDFNWVDGRWK